MRFILFIFLIFVSVPTISQAQDEGLYDPAAPDGSGFIRFVNMLENSDDLEVSIAGKSFGDIGFEQATAYFPVPHGNVPVSMGIRETTAPVQDGNFVTVVATSDADGEIAVFRDPLPTNRAKALLTFYNLGTPQASLSTDDEKVTLADNIDAMDSYSELINPVKIGFIASQNQGGSLNIEPYVFERGQSYGIFYNGDHAIIVRGAMDTTR